MTKKDYVLIAANIADIHTWAVQSSRDAVTAVGEVAARLATALKAESPSFDRARFLAACGVQS